MLEIKARVKAAPRKKLDCPQDGVHLQGKDGKIKGLLSLYFNSRFVPHGVTSFYWRPEEAVGLRIGYSFKWMKALSKKVVQHDYLLMRRAMKLCFAPEVLGFEKVKLNLFYDHKKGHKIECLAFAVRVEHVHYPEKAWEEYAAGNPYDWEADSHPMHSPEGYKFFVDDIKGKVKKLGISHSFKIGDVVWCTKKKRWYLVDTGK